MMMAEQARHGPELLTARQALEQMMRQEVAPALRRLGFTGSFLTFLFKRDSRSAVMRARMSRHNTKQQAEFQLMLTGDVIVSLPGGLGLRALLRDPAPAFGWLVVAGEPTDAVAADVIAAVGRYGVPAMEAMLTDAPRPAGGWPRSFPRSADLADHAPDGGANPAAWFVQPAGTVADRSFRRLTDRDVRSRVGAVGLLEEAMTDPRAVPALLDRLAHDPEPMIRRLVAMRLLAPSAGEPAVRAALAAAAAEDKRADVRWAARYALLFKP